MKLHRDTIVTGLVFTAALSRLLPHPPNFTAVGAIALFGGATLASRWRAIVVPLLAMLVSDALLGLLIYGVGPGFQYALPVYACLVATVFVGRACGRSIPGVGLAAFLATLVFFLVTNFFVWLVGGFYPPTVGGLLACYAAAVPFALSMLAANFVFAYGMFGSLALAERWRPELSR